MVILCYLNIAGDQTAPWAFPGFSSPRGELPSRKFYGSAFYVSFFKNSCFLLILMMITIRPYFSITMLRVETLCKYSLEILYAMRQSVGLNGNTVPANHIGKVINNSKSQNVMWGSDPPLYLTQTIICRGEGIPSCSFWNCRNKPYLLNRLRSTV